MAWHKGRSVPAFLTVVFILIACIPLGSSIDLPCLARDVGIEGRSIVCVCNATYCDTITRAPPDPGTFISYTSSDLPGQLSSQICEDANACNTDNLQGPAYRKTINVFQAGKRFTKAVGVIQRSDSGPDDNSEEDINPEDGENETDFEETLWNRVVYRIYTNRRYQFIEGFGGSVTDAASINWRKLSDATQQKLIDSYYGPEGLEYNLMRIPISGCDFSTHPYTYNEFPWHDAALSNYSLTNEDLFFKLPMIKRAQRAATNDIKVIASSWSPPIWMKTNEAITGFGQLRPEYYQAYADYHLRFLEEYEKAEVKIWAITTTNEPINGIVPWAPFNSLGWWPWQLGRWIAKNLGPTIRSSRFNDTLILGADEQRYLLHVYMIGMESGDPRSIEYLDGIAVHYYGNFFPPAVLTNLQQRYPDKILLSTEACEGAMPWDRLKVEIGSWRRARRYVQSILEDLNNFVVGWLDWNLCLDPTGGPNWANNFVDAPILVYGENDEFIKQPMFYAMGHFSKFIPRGSRRIQISRRSLVTVQRLAVLTPQGNIVVVLQNVRNTERIVRLRISNQRFVEVLMDPNSVTTIEINPN